MSVMKKLSGTNWGANSKILRQVYTGPVRPQLEYRATSWGTAAKTNTSTLWWLGRKRYKYKKTKIPSIKEKSLYSEVELQTLTEEFTDKEYPINTWTHVYTDRSAEKAIKNGGAGIYIRYQNGQKESQSVATGEKSTNFQAETCTYLHTTKTLNSSNNLSNNTFFY